MKNDMPNKIRTMVLTRTLAGLAILVAASHAAAQNTWSMGAPMPTARQWPAVGAVGNKIYVVGGATDSGIVSVNEIYDTKTNTWRTGAPDPTPRVWAAGAVVDGILYVIGGNNGGQLDVVEAYNPATDTWTTGLAPMPTARDSIRAAVDSGIIYAIGGYNGCCGRLATVESYDPATNTWTEEAPMLVAKSDMALGLLGGIIVAAGGLANSGLTDDNEGYNVAKNSWASLTSSANDMGGGCAMGRNGLLYSEVYGAEDNLFQSYDPKTKSWSSLAPLPQPIYVSGSAKVGGRLFCIGGLGGTSNQAVDYVQIYEP
jgi:N-acetylneuraminic acid mutarotase